MRKSLRAVLFLAVLTVFSGSALAQYSIVDPTFDLQVSSSVYGVKWVNAVQATPDGKLLAVGSFNTYNRIPVGKVVRLNADGSLDTTFNNQTVTAVTELETSSRIFIQPDGKIVIKNAGLVAGGLAARSIIRLNADGTLDSSFNYPLNSFIFRIYMDSLGRLVMLGDFTTPQGARRVIRLNTDGSLDTTFNFPLAGNTVQNMVLQGNRPIVLTDVSNDRRIYRLNEDGSEDMSFTPVTGMQLGLGAVQADNKVLYSQNQSLFRLNENGGADPTFQTIDLAQAGNVATLKFTGDGRLVFSAQGSPATFRRFLSDGTVDPSFTPFTTTAFASYTIQSDNSIVMGDGFPFMPSGANNFLRLTPSGTVDATFNVGGSGFQNVQPGVIQAIETLPDGKVLLAGKFDLINDVARPRLVRLNSDSTVDNSFQVTIGGTTGDRFTIIRDIYQVRAHADGKVVVTGFFDYVLNGVTKKNLVRLNIDGSIDPTFNLTQEIPDYSQILIGGQNLFTTYADGKLMVASSRSGTAGVIGPIKLTAGGDRDTSFSSIFQNQSSSIYFDDVVIEPDGKIVAIGSYDSATGFRSFVVRFLSTGGVDPAWPYTEESGRMKGRLVRLSNGKLLIARYAHGGGAARVSRMNVNGTPDSSFTTVTGFDAVAKLNALVVLPTGKIFVGGKFTTTVNGQQARNLLQLDENGGFESTIYNLNEEVLCLAVDSEGRVLVGGGFTVIGANGNGATRAYVARLTNGSAYFDYDGDGRADISVFRPSESKWYILQSSNSSLVERVFAIAGDIPAPADYDGDGRTDVAVFRPSTGDWWYLSSIDDAQINIRWGQAGDIPRPSDFDGDGRTDFVVYRPSNSAWYRLGSTGATSITVFGIGEDKPLVGDFDGDGKSDLAIFRPSTGDWWYAASASGGAFIQFHWGQSGDVPVPADYDGDGKTDLGVFRPSNGGWYVLRSSNGSFLITAFGVSGDKPVPADYDGDGRADLAVFRPSTGLWYLLQTTAGSAAAQWGIATDIPTEAAYVP